MIWKLKSNQERLNNKIMESGKEETIGGVDLSSTTDITCETILIAEKGIKYVLQQYFSPIGNIEIKIPYDLWNGMRY